MRVVDGGRFFYLLSDERAIGTIIYSSTQSKRGSFQSSSVLSVGPKGRSFAIDRASLVSPEILIARSVKGQEIWRRTGTATRPIDVDPKGKFLSLEDGIYDIETGEPIRQWDFESLIHPPVFNSSGTYAIAVIAQTTDTCTWQFIDLENPKLKIKATFPRHARPAAVSRNAKKVIASFGTFGAQLLYTRR